MTDIASQVSIFITDNLLLGRSVDLGRTPSLLEAGVIDSTGILELVQFLEDTWSISIADDEIVPNNLDSLDRIVRFIERKSPSTQSVALSPVSVDA